MAERLHIKNDAAKHVQAYIDYNNVVGKADGGKMMSEQEFEQFKAKKMRQGLGQLDFMSIADAEDKADMMNPNAIMRNMQLDGQAIGGDMQRQMIQAEARGGAMSGQ